jgi:hypothetical protein
MIVLPEVYSMTFTEDEFYIIAEIFVLAPLRTAVVQLCSEDATLLTCDIVFKTVFKWLAKQPVNVLAYNMLIALIVRFEERINDVLKGLLQYLHDPDILHPPQNKGLEIWRNYTEHF